MNDLVERMRTALLAAVKRLAVQVEASQDAEALTECVTHLRILLPIFDAADMLDEAKILRNAITERVGQLATKQPWTESLIALNAVKGML